MHFAAGQWKKYQLKSSLAFLILGAALEIKSLTHFFDFPPNYQVSRCQAQIEPQLQIAMIITANNHVYIMP